VETAADLRVEWFLDAATVGLTAGTSTPDLLINAVESWLRDFSQIPVTPSQTTEAKYELN
jgi:4-hydroxy-3-methylbut-2-enyl diphosphate reductase IspH